MSNERCNTELMVIIGNRLRDIRKATKESQEDVGESTKLNVGRYERGEINISLTTISVFCKYYGITLEEFFKGIEIP